MLFRSVEYVQRLPWSSKLHRGRSKILLRQALRGLVPDDVLRRRKKGFGIPVARWIRGELADEVRRALLEPWPTELDVFDRAALEKLLREHREGASDRYKELWALFMLRQWSENHGAGAPGP